jgi:hypothetical protein
VSMMTGSFLVVMVGAQLCQNRSIIRRETPGSGTTACQTCT